MARADGTALLARLYRPIGSMPDSTLPLVIFFHGGGWCVGDIESYDVFCRQIANASGCAVMSVDYRLAPEHPFPAAIQDAVLATEWAASHADLLAIDPARIAFMGDSAGGTLSIVASILVKQTSSIDIRYLALIYPCTEILSNRPSRTKYADGYFLDRGSLDWFFSRYLPHGGYEDWRASPMNAESLAGLPPAFLVTAEYDPLVDDCVAFADRIRREGGKIEHLAVEGVIHGFVTLGKFFAEAGEAVAEIGVALACALNGRPGNQASAVAVGIPPRTE